ncbi:hypothetical protein [Arhodomonas sp. AD133]|uniref:hypothetical protein n=1 Tax=Arhodomonas sp. AD133 TaxID=3415009 RepID=UPI003EBE9514
MNLNRSANEPMSASITILPAAGHHTVFQVRRAGYQVVPGRDGRMETAHGNETVEKRPRRHHQYGHSVLPGGGPGDGGAAA